MLHGNSKAVRMIDTSNGKVQDNGYVHMQFLNFNDLLSS